MSIPKSVRKELQDYATKHLSPTKHKFLVHVLQNDLAETVYALSEHGYTNYLPAIIHYCYYELEAISWGSTKRFTAWIRAGDTSRGEVASSVSPPTD